MLEHPGQKPVADRLMRAVERVTADPSLYTPDLRGQATTHQVTDAVIAAVQGDNEEEFSEALSHRWDGRFAAGARVKGRT